VGFGGYLLVMILGALISGAAAIWVRSSYSKYSKQMSASGLTGAQVARMILDRNNLTNVKVEGNFSTNSIAAVSVAAHECGHAIQDGSGYLPMKLRAGLFPIVNFAGQLWFPLFFLAIIMGIGTATGQLFIQLAVLAFAGVLAFHVVTLPVEINASTRAYGILTRYGILSRGEADGTKRVLGAAAFTYIAAALTSLLTLLYLLMLSRE
jgi:Zn-dependent membrane protease YugP